MLCGRVPCIVPMLDVARNSSRDRATPPRPTDDDDDGGPRGGAPAPKSLRVTVIARDFVSQRASPPADTWLVIQYADLRDLLSKLWAKALQDVVGEAAVDDRDATLTWRPAADLNEGDIDRFVTFWDAHRSYRFYSPSQLLLAPVLRNETRPSFRMNVFRYSRAVRTADVYARVTRDLRESGRLLGLAVRTSTLRFHIHVRDFKKGKAVAQASWHVEYAGADDLLAQVRAKSREYVVREIVVHDDGSMEWGDDEPSAADLDRFVTIYDPVGGAPCLLSRLASSMVVLREQDERAVNLTIYRYSTSITSKDVFDRACEELINANADVDNACGSPSPRPGLARRAGVPARDRMLRFTVRVCDYKGQHKASSTFGVAVRQNVHDPVALVWSIAARYIRHEVVVDHDRRMSWAPRPATRDDIDKFVLVTPARGDEGLSPSTLSKRLSAGRTGMHRAVVTVFRYSLAVDSALSFARFKATLQSDDRCRPPPSDPGPHPVVSRDESPPPSANQSDRLGRRDITADDFSWMSWSTFEHDLLGGVGRLGDRPPDGHPPADVIRARSHALKANHPLYTSNDINWVSWAAYIEALPPSARDGTAAAGPPDLLKHLFRRATLEPTACIAPFPDDDHVAVPAQSSGERIAAEAGLTGETVTADRGSHPGSITPRKRGSDEAFPIKPDV